MTTQSCRKAATLRSRYVLVAIVCALELAGCTDRSSQQSANDQVDEAVDKTGKAAGAAARKAAELAEVARDKTRDYLTSPEVKQDAAAVKDALKNVGSSAASTTDDAAITYSVSAALAKDAELQGTRIDVQTKNGTVRLAGPAPTAAAKARAGEI